MNPHQRYFSGKTGSPFQSNPRINHQPIRSRSKSPRNLKTNKSYISNSSQGKSSNPNTTFNSEYLRDSLEDLQLFPTVCIELMKFEDRNINGFKRMINNEKNRINSQIEALTLEINHIIQDYRLSLQAVLDRIYQNYITRYADFKSEILQINRLKDQVQIQIMSGGNVDMHSVKSYGNSGISNEKTIRSMEMGKTNLRKFHLLNYIADLQKDKVIPVTERGQEILILTEYQNGFFQPEDFNKEAANLRGLFRQQFHLLLERVFTYVRDPDSLIGKERQCLEMKYGGKDEGNRKQFTNERILDRLEDKTSRGDEERGRRKQQVSNYHSDRVKTNKYVFESNQGYYPSQPYLHDQSVQQIRNQGNSSRSDLRSNQPHQKVPSFSQHSQMSFSPNNRPNSQFHQTHYHSHHHSIVSRSPINSETLKVQKVGSIKTTAPDIILSCLWVDETLVVTGNKDGSLIFYNPKSNSPIPTPSKMRHKSSICSLAILNDGQYLASGSDHPNPEIILWNLENLEPVCSLKEHKSAVSAISCLRDSEHFISGGYDKRLCVYSVHERRLKYTLPSNKSSVTAICINSDGTKMISCGLEGNVLNVWQIVKESSNQKVQTLFLEQIIENNTMICSVVASSVNNSIVYVGTKDGKIKIVDIEKGSSVKTLSCCNVALIEMMVVQHTSADTLPIILGWPCKEKCLKIVDCQTGKVQNVNTPGQLEFSCGVGPKATSNLDGSGFAMGSQGEDRQIYFYHLDKTNF